MTRPALTRDFILRHLSYCPETGVFTRLVSAGGQKAGAIAGTTTTHGYRTISLMNYRFYAHFLAWVIMTGHIPEVEIDHKNTRRSDNWWNNLRAATESQNRWNAPAPKANTSGIKGVRRKARRWAVEIKAHGKSHWLGYFSTPEEAAAAYSTASKKLHGEFSRT